ncbi:MAG: hypothetical protein QOF44_562 [Streptomyces sp.]|nr:hypothetical protein [Streptomyces sp.]
MSQHRRKRHYRKMAVVAVAIAAVGVPSVAMACMDRQGDAGSQSYGHWKSASYSHRWAHGKSWATPKPTATPTLKSTPTPTPKSTPKSTATPSQNPSSATARVVALVNSERSKVGCSALAVNAKLTTAAQSHSTDMADSQTMSHNGSDGSSPGTRITRAGYTWSTYGENVAYGYATPESVMAGWMSSPGHKANILNCAFKEIGVGHAQPGDYWTQDFGTAR